jgi:uncharacterized repeat protein (TIGR01451 family)
LTHQLYVATTAGLAVYDILDPENPVLMTTLLTGLDFVSVRGLEGHGYVYAASFSDNTIQVIRTSDNVVVGSLSFGMSGMIRNPWVYQDEAGDVFLYVVNDLGDLWIVDINSPETLTSLDILTAWNSPLGGAANMPGGASYVEKDYAFVLTSDGNDDGYLYMLDVRDPTNPVLVDTLYDSGFGFNDIRMDGCEIHIAAHDGWKMYTMVGWQPDTWISNTDGSNYIGQDVYEDPVATEQVKSQDVAPLETATFQIRIENDADRRDRFYVSGTGSATGWTVQYLEGATDVTADITDPSGTAYLAPTDGGYLDPGDFFELTLNVTPDFDASCGDTYEVNIVPDSWMCPDGTCSGAPDAVQALVTVGCPEMTVAKDDGLITVVPGQAVQYEIIYSNTGNAAAANVTIIDVLPAGMNYVSASPSAATVQADTPGAGQTTLTWNVGTIPAGSGPYTILLNASVDQATLPGSDLLDTVTLDYEDGNGNPYPQEDDDDLDAVTGPPIEKSVDKGNSFAGDTLTYDIVVDYQGTTLLSNAVITDAIPAGTTYVGGSASAGGSYDGGSNTVSWSLGSNTAAVAGIVSTGNLSALYALRGDGTNAFWAYDTNGDTWTTLANAPGNVKQGGALTYDGT